MLANGVMKYSKLQALFDGTVLPRWEGDI